VVISNTNKVAKKKGNKKQQTPAERAAFFASKKYHTLYNNLLGCERNGLADENTLAVMRKEVAAAKKEMDIAEANAAY
jgi:hypothetical protein